MRPRPPVVGEDANVVATRVRSASARIGGADEADLLKTERRAESAWGSLLASPLRQPIYAVPQPPLLILSTGVATALRFFNRWLAPVGVAPVVGADFTSDTERKLISDTVRDIFGNPFRPVTLDHLHRTPTIVSLARSAYD